MKTIFRQITREYAYYIDNEYYCGIPCGLMVFSDNNSGDIISDDIIASCDTEIPTLKVGEKIILNTDNTEVTIKKRNISTDGSIVYYIEDKLVETEYSEQELLRLEKECDEYNEKYGY